MFNIILSGSEFYGDLQHFKGGQFLQLSEKEKIVEKVSL